MRKKIKIIFYHKKMRIKLIQRMIRKKHKDMIIKARKIIIILMIFLKLIIKSKIIMK
jgi:hypothetical protein